MINIDDSTKIFAWLRELTVYSSNFADLKQTIDTNSKVKYRVSDVETTFDRSIASFIEDSSAGDHRLHGNDEQRRATCRCANVESCC
jgi:hypothetical protein